jgi:2-C-methyl-D-erythritol 4-phosphate cytidylyltransferase
VIEHALAPFLADVRCQQIIVALDASDVRFATLPAARDPRVKQVAGGAQRCDSVRNALSASDGADHEWVLVHDAARPCVTRADIDRLLAAAGGDAVGGVLAVPLADTLKRADGSGDAPRVADTPARAGLWRAVTPQMFPAGLLRAALAAAQKQGREPTDEAQAIEWLGHAPLTPSGLATT